MKGLAELITLILICTVNSEEDATGVRITANISTADGVGCPEPTELRCRTCNVEGLTSLSWTHDDSIRIIEPSLDYIFQTGDTLFPDIVLAENRSSAFIGYGIESAHFDSNKPSVVNFTAVLVVNLELLFGSDYGYRSLQCGGVAITDSFVFNQLDMEVPSVPAGVILHVIYDVLSSYLLQRVEIESERPVYSSNNSCSYKNNTYFNISLIIGGSPSARMLTYTSCSGETCLLGVDVPEDSGSDDFQVLLAVGNTFGESDATVFEIPSSVQSIFDVSVSYIDCETLVECTGFESGEALACTVRYGRDPSFLNLSGTQLLINESLPLSNLEDGTTYYFEAVYTSMSTSYHLQLNYTSGICNRKSSAGIIVGVVVGFVVLLVLVSALIIIVVILSLKVRRRGRRGSGNIEERNLKAHRSDGGVAGDEYKDPYHAKLEDGDEHLRFNETKDAAQDRQVNEDMQKSDVSIDVMPDRRAVNEPSFSYDVIFPSLLSAGD